MLLSVSTVGWHTGRGLLGQKAGVGMNEQEQAMLALVESLVSEYRGANPDRQVDISTMLGHCVAIARNLRSGLPSVVLPQVQALAQGVLA